MTLEGRFPRTDGPKWPRHGCAWNENVVYIPLLSSHINFAPAACCCSINEECTCNFFQMAITTLAEQSRLQPLVRRLRLTRCKICHVAEQRPWKSSPRHTRQVVVAFGLPLRSEPPQPGPLSFPAPVRPFVTSFGIPLPLAHSLRSWPPCFLPCLTVVSFLLF